MTQESLDILTNAPVGTTVEVEGRKIKLQALDDWQASGDWCACHGCACEITRDCDAQDPPICDAEVRDDNINVRFLDITNCPWQDWPDAKRDGMCEIPVVIARNLRALLDQVTPNQWLDADLTGNDQIEACIYLDNAISGSEGMVESKYFTRIEESGWAAYIDESKTNAALYPFGVGNTEAEAVEWLENSILVLEDMAAANGYVKLAHDEIIAKRGTSGEVCFGTVDIGAMVRKFGYIKLEPGECVVKYEKWLPYLKKAYDAARLMEKHGAFTVKWYHNDWPSIEMLDELTAAIEASSKGA